MDQIHLLFMRKTFSVLFWLFFTGLSLSNTASDLGPAKGPFVVVLDAGHGGHDPGNSWNGFSEKKIALEIVLKVGAELEKLPNVKVLYTRKSDVFITLAGRAEIANKADADLFVSVHMNGHKSQAQGNETFVLGLHRSQDNLEVAMRENEVIYLEEDYKATYDGFDPQSPESYIGLTLMQEEYLEQSILLANFVQMNFATNLNRINRGVKQAGFLVLRETYMPSVLIEAGFLSNKTEGAYLNSDKGQAEVSKSIVDAIKKYRNSINLEVLNGLTDNLPIELATAPADNVNDAYDGITFKVQIAATGKKVDSAPKNFNGLREVERIKEGKLYKYYFGATSSYLQIKELHDLAKKKGYQTSYIVAFRENVKITLNEALKTQNR